MLAQAPHVLEPFFADWLKLMLRLFLYVAAALFFVHTIIAVFFPYSLDYGEAPLVDQAMRLAAGKNIYRPDISSPPYTISNYPPLYILAMTPFVKLFGPMFLAGRMISILSTLASASCLALIIHSFSQDRVAATATGLFFLTIPFVVYWSPLARVDMLALAFATGGLCVLARQPTTRKGIVLGSLLLVATIYTRQSYALAAPLAAFVWLWTHERRRAIELAVIVGGLVLLLFVILNLLTRGGFFYNIVTANVNDFSFERLRNWLQELWDTVPILLVLGAVFLFLAPTRRLHGWPLLVPFLISAFLSALTIGKIGSNANYFLELAAALSLVAGALIAWSGQHHWRYWGLLLLLTLQTGWLMGSTLNGPVARLSFRTKDPPALKQLKEMVDEVHGPVLADEQMGMLTLQKQPLYLQPFEVTQLALAGLWDQTPLLQSIANHKFPLILVYHFPFAQLEDAQRWTPEMLTAIEEHYAVVKNMDGNVVYRPKGQQQTITVPPPVQQPGFDPTSVEVSPLQRVSQAPFVYEPHIAVNPVQPDHLAAAVVKADDLNCIRPECQVHLLLYTSTDSGLTWTEQVPLDEHGAEFQEGMTSFGADGTLYTLGLHDRMGVNRSYADSPPMPYQVVPTQTVSVPSAQVYLKPWLQVDAHDGEIRLAYSGRYRSNLSINLKRSTNGGTWTAALPVGEGIPLSGAEAGQATFPFGPQLIAGNEASLAIVWTWGPGFWRWPTGVWLATSDDGGQTFSPPRQIADTWGFVSAASRNSTYYLSFRWGTEQDQDLVVATSRDGGATWSSVAVNGGLPLYFDPTKAPGVDVAPNGTIDVVFYAHSQDATGCAFELEDWRQFVLGGTWTDTCMYDVFYTYSKDGGQTFSVPLRLNEVPIRGERFVQVMGMSLAGYRLGMASTDEFAYPLWIETQGEEGTQAFTVRIGR